MSKEIRDEAVEVEAKATEVLSEGFRPMIRHTIRHRRHDGHWSATMTRDLHAGNHVAAVIAYDLERDKLVLIRQFRLAANIATGRGVMVEIVAGGVEPGETAEAAARRELHEETRLQAGAMIHCFDFMPSPGITTEYATVFLASVDSANLPESAGEDEDEDIAPFVIAYDDALALAASGSLMNGFLLQALNWLGATGKAKVRAMLEDNER